MATISNLSGQTVSTLDALWALIQCQKQSVRKALLKRFMEDEMLVDETFKQQMYIRNSIEKGWTEVQGAATGTSTLKSADDLLLELMENKK